MQITPFPRPSCLTDVIHFRVPTVEDAIAFTDLSEEQEEMNTTLYLNKMQDLARQDGKLNDAAKWTGQDRRTALWWIFVSSREIPEITVSYECQTCKEKHYVEVNLLELGETSQAFRALEKYTFDAYVSGEKASGVTVRPLNGADCEILEGVASELAMCEENSAAWRLAKYKLHLYELALSVDFPNQPKEHHDALEYKLERIRAMALDTEFRSFSAHVERGNRAQRHGLLTDYKNGRYFLVYEHANCQKAIQAGEEQSKLLLLPFRGNDFIAAL